MADIETLAADTRYYSEVAAPGTPSAGTGVVYAKTDGKLYFKNDAGTETELTGAGGGGDVATDAIWDAKGDLAGGTGADAAAKLTVGANGTALVADSGEATGMKWAAAPAYVGVGVRNAGTQSINDVTSTELTFNTEDWDTDAFHDTGSNTERLTVPAGKAGKYLIEASTWWASNSTGFRWMAIRKNGAAFVARDQLDTGSGSQTSSTTKAVVDLVATDYITIEVYQNSGGALACGHASSTHVQSRATMTLLGT